MPCVYKIACGHVALIFSWQKQAVLFYTACLILEISVYTIFKLYFSVYYDGQNAAEEFGMFCPAVCARIPTGKMSQDTSSIECKLILNMLVRLVNGNKCSSSISCSNSSSTSSFNNVPLLTAVLGL